MTFRLICSSFAAIPFAAALLFPSYPAKADTLTARFNFLAPVGGPGIAFGPTLYARGTGSWSISSDLVSGLPNIGSANLRPADLTAFNFSVSAELRSGDGQGGSTSLGQQATFQYTLADLTSFLAPIQRQGNGFVSQGFTFTTNAVSGSNAAFGVGSFAGPSNSVANAIFSITGTSFPGLSSPTSFATRGVTGGVNPDGASQPIEYVDTTTASPEPASFLLAVPAVAGLWFMRRRKAGSILCVATLALFAGSIHGATITSQAQCSAGGNNDTGMTSCTASGFDTVQGRQIATGNSSVSYQVSGNQFQWDQRANASDTTLGVVKVDTTLSAVLETGGPLRPGFVTGPFLIQNHGAQPSVFFPGYANRLEFGLGAGAPPIPITLGGLFSFTSAIHIQPFDGEGDASIVGRIQFFEADGVTPVGVSEVSAAPEPGSLALAGPAIAGLWFWRRKKAA